MGAPNTNPNYPITITTTCVNTTGTANTSRVDPPTASSVVDGPVAGSYGAVVSIVTAVATVATTAGIFQVWHKLSGGTYKLIHEVVTTAITPSTTAIAATAFWIPADSEYFLPAGERLAFTVSKAEVWTVSIAQKDY